MILSTPPPPVLRGTAHGMRGEKAFDRRPVILRLLRALETFEQRIKSCFDLTRNGIARAPFDDGVFQSRSRATDGREIENSGSSGKLVGTFLQSFQQGRRIRLALQPLAKPREHR